MILRYLSEDDLEIGKHSEQADEVVSTGPAVEKTKKSTWGPIIPMRRSNRVEIVGRTMLEIAMDSKAIQNLGKEKTSFTGTIIKNSFDHFNDPKFMKIANQIGVEIDSTHPRIEDKTPAVIDTIDSNGCHPSFTGNTIDSFFNTTSTAKHPGCSDREVSHNTSTNDSTGCPPSSSAFPVVEKPSDAAAISRHPRCIEKEGNTDSNSVNIDIMLPDNLLEDEYSCSSPHTPLGLKGINSEFLDHSVLWSDVSKYGRGKHPRTKHSR